MYDDKWIEANNSQNGPQTAGSQPGMGQAAGQEPQPARKQVYGLSPRARMRTRRISRPSTRTFPSTPLPIPTGDRTETAG